MILTFEFEPDYIINTLGEVFSFKYKNPRKMKLDISNRYPTVAVAGGKRYPIHRLLALKFIPNPNNLPVVRHKDGIVTNNLLSNLEWGTHKDNEDDKKRHGTWERSHHSNRKLSNIQILEIRNSILSSSVLSKMYNISKTNISDIKRKKIWKDLI